MDLHDAADYGNAEAVAALAATAPDVDELAEGRTPLWRAVFAGKPDNARALVAAGADPHRPMMSGWSPARLAAAGPTPDLFGPPATLSDHESALLTESTRLRSVLGETYLLGLGLACVAGIDVAETTRRLHATPCTRDDNDLAVVGASDVPGGTVLTQPMGYRPQQQDVHERLSPGTFCYALYENPKSGTQGSLSRNGVLVAADLFPAGEAMENEPSDQVLLAYTCRHDAIAYACALTGLRLPDARPITGPPDVWLRLPN
ncbi:ankyrin repeat domain-containing protein [Actinophytocola xinjiangensis]|uniref:ankyrin repeat domain-containing protein n=1 Tax=Actinophytocola xinjiangensis TaxID=485602 RepID=UPI000B122146|nr:ankyrin repeat domain-containing protein [Actinophytocola xinjiangensis]